MKKPILETVVRLACTALLTAALSAAAGLCCGAEEAPKTVIRIGTIFDNRPLPPFESIEESVEELRRALPDKEITLHAYSYRGLEHALENREVDFFFASAGFMLRMRAKYGIVPVATVVTRERPDPNHGSGGVFFTLADRSDIYTIADMKDKNFVASEPTAFHGYFIALGEIQRWGYDPEHFFKTVSFSGANTTPIFDMIRRREADVGYIRVCRLEELRRLDPAIVAGIKVINPQPGDLPCALSTKTYPNNMLGAIKGTDHELISSVAIHLLGMPKTASGQSWSLASDLTAVDALYRDLKMGPYEYLRRWTWRRFVQEHIWGLSFLFLLISALAAYSWFASVRIKRSARALIAEHKRRLRYENKARRLTEQIERQHRINLIGNLSSIFAHELNQPLAACTYYLDGLLSLLRSKTEDRKLIEMSLNGMSGELTRMSEIVERVRFYAKASPKRDAAVDLKAIISEVLNAFRLKYKSRAEYKAHLTDGCLVTGDALEYQILFWNLIKNATEAGIDDDGAKVTIALYPDETETVCEITNNGRVLTDEEFQALSVSALKSDKQQGLGMGLSIVRSIIETNAGSLRFAARGQGGVVTMVRLPLKAKDSE
jgi:two-component system sensor histidine kinase TtrS